MNSTELRRIVGAMTPEIVAQVLHDLEWDAHRRETLTAVRTLANHADALVALVQACESTQGLDTSDPAFWRGMEAMYDAIAAVHAIKTTP